MRSASAATHSSFWSTRASRWIELVAARWSRPGPGPPNRIEPAGAAGVEAGPGQQVDRPAASANWAVTSTRSSTSITRCAAPVGRKMAKRWPLSAISSRWMPDGSSSQRPDELVDEPVPLDLPQARDHRQPRVEVEGDARCRR